MAIQAVAAMTTDDWKPSDRKRQPRKPKQQEQPAIDIVERLIAFNAARWPLLNEAAITIKQLRETVNAQAAVIERLTRDRP